MRNEEFVIVVLVVNTFFLSRLSLGFSLTLFVSYLLDILSLSSCACFGFGRYLVSISFLCYDGFFPFVLYIYFYGVMPF